MRVRAGGKVATAVAGGVLAVAVAACGSGAGAPEGWRPFDAGPVRLFHPKRGWVRLSGPALGGDAGAAVLWRRGRELGRISVRTEPAAGAPGPPAPGAAVRSSRRMTIDGRRMRKTEYTYTATAASQGDTGRGVAPGTLVRGVDLVTERSAPAVLVRINAAAGALRQAQFAQIVNSVSLLPPAGR
jgi:hypothetical protein